MDLPNEVLDIMIPVILVAGAIAFVGYFTKSGMNFRSSRNKKARKQF